MKIKCVTLFDITKTNISNRRNLFSDNVPGLVKQRNQQSNLETLLQVIGLRSQPEDITDPEVITAPKEYWSSAYNKKTVKSWEFTFTVGHKEIFRNDSDELGNLKSDCNGVPMIIGLDEGVELVPTLECYGEHRNIHFTILDE
jgi:hypothetical protein